MYIEAMRRLEGGGDYRNRPKRCQKRRFGPRLVFFYILVFFILNIISKFYICILKLRGELRGAATAKMGPNDARHVVLALGKFLFIYSYILYTKHYF